MSNTIAPISDISAHPLSGGKTPPFAWDVPSLLYGAYRANVKYVLHHLPTQKKRLHERPYRLAALATSPVLTGEAKMPYP